MTSLSEGVFAAALGCEYQTIRMQACPGPGAQTKAALPKEHLVDEIDRDYTEGGAEWVVPSGEGWAVGPPGWDRWVEACTAKAEKLQWGKMHDVCLPFVGYAEPESVGYGQTWIARMLGRTMTVRSSVAETDCSKNEIIITFDVWQAYGMYLLATFGGSLLLRRLDSV